jgi:hypothetical protein
MPAPAAMMTYRMIFSSSEMFCASAAPPHRTHGEASAHRTHGEASAECQVRT